MQTKLGIQEIRLEVILIGKMRNIIKHKAKIILWALLLLVIALFVISLAGATTYRLICLNQGQQIRFSQCNPLMRDRTCDSSSCSYCVSVVGNNTYCSASPNVCNGLGLGCTPLNSTSVDREPPHITLITPTEGRVYLTKNLYLGIDISEQADLKILDLLNNRSSWMQLCDNCFFYNRSRYFVEGLNKISIKAIDGAENSEIKNLSFFIDTIKPSVTKISPNTGFTNGSILVEFREINPKLLQVIYEANGTTPEKSSINIQNCSKLADKYSCKIYLDLSKYNNKTISLSVFISDISNKNVTTNPVKLIVDTAPPVIKSFSSNLKIKNLNVTFVINESNFAQVKYIDNSALYKRWITICSILSKSTCAKIIYLSSGQHSLDFLVSDKAGNTASQHLDITV